MWPGRPGAQWSLVDLMSLSALLTHNETAQRLGITEEQLTAFVQDGEVAYRLWNDSGQYDAEPQATETNLARLIEYFGPTKLLTEIDHRAAKELVAWRRGHRVSRRGKLTKERREALPLVSNATVNRSTS